MENKIINLGIIGAGRMGITHYSIINTHPNVKIKGIAEPSKHINSILKKYLNDISTFKDADDLFNSIPLDAILVCTPPNSNYKIIKKAFDLGLHVFVEKPFTINTDHALELSYLFDSKNYINQVGYVNRFNDVFCKAREFVNENLIGNIIRFKSEMFSATITKMEEGSNWRMKKENGGGVVYEMASHAIDLVNYIIGKPDIVAGTVLTKIHSINVEDIVSSTFLYDNGISGTIYVNWSDESYRKPTNKIEIFGSEGKILADQHSLKIFLKEPIKLLNFNSGWNTLYITDLFKPVPFYVRGNEFTSQLYHFVDSILGNTSQQISTFADGIETLEIIDKIYKDYN